MNVVEAKEPVTTMNTGPEKTGTENWTKVCSIGDITPDTGVCVLLDGEQVAVFRDRKLDRVFAISNFDPIGEANVLSRGIIGSISGELVVASPLYKQHFSLTTGKCLEDESKPVKVFAVRVVSGEVQLAH